MGVYSSSSVATATTSAVLPSVAALAVYLRFRARRIKQLPYKSDDWLVLAAMVIAIALACTVFEGSFRGSIGQDFATLTPADYASLFKHLYSVSILSTISVCFVKCSIIQFYKRIFPSQKFSRSANVLLVFVVLWGLTTVFAQVFCAWPISNFWTAGKHLDMNYGAMGTSLIAVDILCDIMILSLPLPTIFKLQMSRIRKIQITGIFWLGIFCVVSASLRFYYTFQLSFGDRADRTNKEYQSVDTGVLIWGQIEPCTSIIAGCLPCITALVRGNHSPESIVRSVRSLFTRSPGSSLRSLNQNGRKSDEETGAPEPNGEWHKLQELGAKGATYTGNVAIGEHVDNLQSQQGIMIKQSFQHTIEQPKSTT